MFQEFFGLREQPFGVTPDPRYLYLAPAHREALASLFYGIESNRGFLALIARPGMGKTTLLFHLLEKFRNRARTAFLFQTQCSSREFMRLLLAEVGLESDGRDFVQMHEAFNRSLLQTARDGRRFIIVIDEAQNLDPPVLETVRLLSDFETPRAKLLQIILAGQPELAEKLAHPGLSQLRQRITSFNGLKPFPTEQTARFIEHRLRVAGYEGEALFDAQAVGLIAELSEGIPRNINNLCFHSLSLAFAMQQKTVDVGVVQEVADDLDIRHLLTEESRQQHFGLDMNYRQEWDGERSALESRSQFGRSNGDGPELLSPDEARAHMQEVTRFLQGIPGSSTKPVRPKRA
ncbi:MAG TPA: AAA family ATPase [Candidatus Sulfotelmatobacter sp.]|jgi:general secretion pathway protein A|nr:AAA family ATPase [Candidatus Sulfotelmatobacter sp.]